LNIKIPWRKLENEGEKPQGRNGGGRKTEREKVHVEILPIPSPVLSFVHERIIIRLFK